MSIIFQLFRADDLKQLNAQQIVEIKEIVQDEMKKSRDTSLESFIAVSKNIKNVRMTRLLPREEELPELIQKEPELQKMGPGQPENFIKRGARQYSLAVAREEDQEYSGELINLLKQRAHDVFQQLMSESPTEQVESAAQAGELSTDLLERLLSQRDLDRLKTRLGTKGHVILAWALTCELANLKTYETLQRMRARTESHFIKITGHRPKGPDSYYSPFHPLHPLNIPSYLGQP